METETSIASATVRMIDGYLIDQECSVRNCGVSIYDRKSASSSLVAGLGCCLKHAPNKLTSSDFQQRPISELIFVLDIETRLVKGLWEVTQVGFLGRGGKYYQIGISLDRRLGTLDIYQYMTVIIEHEVARRNLTEHGNKIVLAAYNGFAHDFPFLGRVIRHLIASGWEVTLMDLIIPCSMHLGHTVTLFEACQHLLGEFKGKWHECRDDCFNTFRLLKLFYLNSIEILSCSTIDARQFLALPRCSHVVD